MNLRICGGGDSSLRDVGLETLRVTAIKGTPVVTPWQSRGQPLTQPAKERRTEALYVMACWTSYCARKIAFGIIP